MSSLVSTSYGRTFSTKFVNNRAIYNHISTYKSNLRMQTICIIIAIMLLPKYLKQGSSLGNKFKDIKHKGKRANYIYIHMQQNHVIKKQSKRREIYFSLTVFMTLAYCCTAAGSSGSMVIFSWRSIPRAVSNFFFTSKKMPLSISFQSSIRMTWRRRHEDCH